MESAQAERAEVDVPFAVVDLDEAHVFLAQGLTDGSGVAAAPGCVRADACTRASG